MGTGIPSFSQDYPSSDHRNVCRLFCGKSLPVIEEWAFNMLRRDSTLGYVKHIRTCTLLRKKPTNTNKKKKPNIMYDLELIGQEEISGHLHTLSLPICLHRPRSLVCSSLGVYVKPLPVMFRLYIHDLQ